MASQILDSVERLKKLKLSDLAKSENMEKLHDQSVEEPRGENKITSVKNHVYCMKEYNVTQPEVPRISEFHAREISQILNNPPQNTFAKQIDQELTRVSKFGKSILFNKSVKELCENHWFNIVLLEMAKVCPDLLEILLSSVGELILLVSTMDSDLL